MTDQQAKGKKIVKNTIMMYIRMFITMLISLYTSRIVLNALGVEDFGIFNVVGGMVSLFAVVNAAMQASTQRFINYEMGRSDNTALSAVFKTSYIIHIGLAIFVVIIGEILGLYFLNYKLQIPVERHIASAVVLQVSLLICAIQILALPFSADVIAHEKIDVYAYVSIGESLLKLIVALLISVSDYDRLELYAVLLLMVQSASCLFYIIYCRIKFPEVRGKYKIDKIRVKEIASFATWSLIGCMSGVFATQGLNVLLGMFFSPVVNAARGIAVQVQAAVVSFGGNLNTAMTPQITQSYASGDKTFFFQILYRGSKYVFFLMALVACPILLRTDYILNLWLGTVPEYTGSFIRWLIYSSLVETISYPLMRASDASGKIRMYHSVVGGILLMILPVAYVVLKLGYNPISVFIVHFCISVVAWTARLVILNRTVHLSIGEYFKKVIACVVPIFIVTNVVSWFLTKNISQDFLGLLLVIVISILINCSIIWFFGFEKSEKNFLKNKLLKVIPKNGKFVK